MTVVSDCGGVHPQLTKNCQAFLPEKSLLSQRFQKLSVCGWTLAYQLADPNSLGAARVGAIMYASPKLGDHNFVNGFDSRVTNYIVINFEHDVVPLVPPFDITHFDLYRPLPYVYTITDETALASVNPLDKACCHHLIDYIAMLSPPVFNQSKQTWTDDEKQCAKCVLGLRG